MFENLVESGSHKEDVKRKGSFLLVTLGVYGVLIVAGLIAGILMAPAYIDQQTLELTALIAPVPVPQAAKPAEVKPEKVIIEKNVDVRKELIADVSRADLVPKTVSAKASEVPPVRKGVVTMVGTANTNTVAPIAPGTTGSIISAPTKVEVKARCRCRCSSMKTETSSRRTPCPDIRCCKRQQWPQLARRSLRPPNCPDSQSRSTA